MSRTFWILLKISTVVVITVLSMYLPLPVAILYITHHVVIKVTRNSVCVFIKLHITAQSGPVILVILCHSH